MNNNSNMLQLCRLCLVKDEVNIPIFEEQGDIRQIFLKISSCLPVKVSRDDQLPKKICDGCSYKLDMLYEFWNTSANAEKQLLTWLGEAGMTSQMTDGTISAVAQQIKPADAFVKQETIDPPDILKDDDDEDEEDKDYMKQEESSNNVTEEPPPKRARRTAAVKAAIALDQNSDDDDDSGEPMTKVEDDSDDSDNDDHEPAFVDVPSTSADDQPGPSGVGKEGVEAPLDIRKSFKLRKLSVVLTKIRIEPPTKKNKNEILTERKKDYTCYVCMQKFPLLDELLEHKQLHSEAEDEIEEDDRFEEDTDEKEAKEDENSSSGTENKVKNMDVLRKEPQTEVTKKRSRRTKLEMLNFKKRRASKFMSLFKKQLEKPKEIKILPKPDGKIFNVIPNLPKSDSKILPEEPKPAPVPAPTQEENKEQVKTPFKCDTCNVYFATSDDVKVHSSSTTTKCKFSCHLCNRKMNTIYAFIVHVMQHKNNTIKSLSNSKSLYACSSCDKSFADCFQLRRHEINSHNLRPSAEPVVSEPTEIITTNVVIGEPESENLTCDLCYDVFTTKEDLDNHTEFHKEISIPDSHNYLYTPRQTAIEIIEDNKDKHERSTTLQQAKPKPILSKPQPAPSQSQPQPIISLIPQSVSQLHPKIVLPRPRKILPSPSSASQSSVPKSLSLTASIKEMIAPQEPKTKPSKTIFLPNIEEEKLKQMLNKKFRPIKPKFKLVSKNSTTSKQNILKKANAMKQKILNPTISIPKDLSSNSTTSNNVDASLASSSISAPFQQPGMSTAPTNLISTSVLPTNVMSISTAPTNIISVPYDALPNTSFSNSQEPGMSTAPTNIISTSVIPSNIMSISTAPTNIISVPYDALPNTSFSNSQEPGMSTAPTSIISTSVVPSNVMSISTAPTNIISVPYDALPNTSFSNSQTSAAAPTNIISTSVVPTNIMSTSTAPTNIISVPYDDLPNTSFSNVPTLENDEYTSLENMNSTLSITQEPTVSINSLAISTDSVASAPSKPKPFGLVSIDKLTDPKSNFSLFSPQVDSSPSKTTDPLSVAAESSSNLPVSAEMFGIGLPKIVKYSIDGTPSTSSGNSPITKMITKRKRKIRITPVHTKMQLKSPSAVSSPTTPADTPPTSLSHVDSSKPSRIVGGAGLQYIILQNNPKDVPQPPPFIRPRKNPTILPKIEMVMSLSETPTTLPQTEVTNEGKEDPIVIIDSDSENEDPKKEDSNKTSETDNGKPKCDSDEDSNLVIDESLSKSANTSTNDPDNVDDQFDECESLGEKKQEDDIMEITDISGTEKNTFYCKFCDETSNKLLDLKMHYLNVHKRFFCWRCRYTTESLNDFIIHRRTHTTL
ncbi:uncharacterized protein [Diabrotica undecimpunctata]|uniref:uncharacterized protein isoform X1 n=1 Tax=Diabrotica undecimpunctata TaxID=50387 RepID=UPI003B638ED4